jgi:hypothetical protein
MLDFTFLFIYDMIKAFSTTDVCRPSASSASEAKPERSDPSPEPDPEPRRSSCSSSASISSGSSIPSRLASSTLSESVRLKRGLGRGENL